MRLPKVMFVICLTGLVQLGQIPVAEANIGPRWWGDVVTEPWGLSDVTIAHEQLTIDLRSLAACEPVQVEVIYTLNNVRQSKKLDLVFVSGEVGVSDFEARLDQKQLATRPLSRSDLRRHWDRFPKNWEPPRTFPGMEGDTTYCMLRDRTTQALPVELFVELPTGSSTLCVRYRAQACGTDEGHPTVTWQFPYVLAPAREWGGFGGLDVRVNVPDNWEVRSTPELEREGGTLRGSFTGLPADALVVAARAPVPSSYEQTKAMTASIYAVLVLGGAFLCCWFGWRHGRSNARRVISTDGKRRRVTGRTLLLAIIVAASWGGLVFAAGAILPIRLIRHSLNGQESPYFHEPYLVMAFFSLFLAAPAAVLFGFVLTLVSAAIANTDFARLRRL